MITRIMAAHERKTDTFDHLMLAVWIVLAGLALPLALNDLLNWH